MSKCSRCGKEVSFINRKDKKSLVVNKNPINFIPDSSGDSYFIHNGVMRRGFTAYDGLLGHTLHNCEGQ